MRKNWIALTAVLVVIIATTLLVNKDDVFGAFFGVKKAPISDASSNDGTITWWCVPDTYGNSEGKKIDPVEGYYKPEKWIPGTMTSGKDTQKQRWTDQKPKTNPIPPQFNPGAIPVPGGSGTVAPGAGSSGGGKNETGGGTRPTPVPSEEKIPGAANPGKIKPGYKQPAEVLPCPEGMHKDWTNIYKTCANLAWSIMQGEVDPNTKDPQLQEFIKECNDLQPYVMSLPKVTKNECEEYGKLIKNHVFTAEMQKKGYDINTAGNRMNACQLFYDYKYY